MSDCRHARRLAADAELGTLDEADRLRLELHLEGCPACAAETGRVRGLAALLRAQADAQDAADADDARSARALA
ncbi:MAG: zf-HC2 domain-containing protein, partial [Sandaracinaceae bacterium]|nr:zf-HC2 domain-containing protein [Sandaracinaceae bacterium]